MKTEKRIVYICQYCDSIHFDKSAAKTCEQYCKGIEEQNKCKHTKFNYTISSGGCATKTCLDCGDDLELYVVDCCGCGPKVAKQIFDISKKAYKGKK